MRVTHLSLTNFRNYGRLEIDFPAGATLLHGQNAQGKTNLLEAIYYLATTRSPHAIQDSQLLNWQAAQAPDPIVVGRLVATVTTSAATRQIEMRLIQERRGNGSAGFRREALVNRRKVRLMDVLGNLRVVLFLPEDVQLITGPPSARRRYMNATLCQVDPAHCHALSQYNKILEQRNALLRQLAEGQGSRELLAIYTEQLVEWGSQIFARRAQFFEEIGRDAQRIHYEELTDGRELLRLQYAPRLDAPQNGAPPTADVNSWLPAGERERGLLAQRFGEQMRASRRADIARGATNLGPHRDDWRMEVNGRDLGSFGSRGQQRTAILALKLAEIHWMITVTGETPVLLLDEVVAELDEQRRERLLATVQNAAQAILTATDPGMFANAFLQNATSMTVANGRVTLNQPGGKQDGSEQK